MDAATMRMLCPLTRWKIIVEDAMHTKIQGLEGGWLAGRSDARIPPMWWRS
jgi:hypothetical protein